MKNYIPSEILEINNIFTANNKQLFLVGGCVRDFIIDSDNYNPKDFDLCTDAYPDEVISMLSNKYRCSLHGKAYAVVQVFTSETCNGFEIATFRSDNYDGKLGLTRNPEVEMSDMSGDSNRRDLTMNALYYDISNDNIIDLHNGIDDIKNKKIRFVGDANLRLLEDPLRAFRAIRFAITYGFVIDNSAYEAMMSVDISTLSKERLFCYELGEFMKSYRKANNKKDLFKMLDYYGLVSKMFMTEVPFSDTNSLHKFIVSNIQVKNRKKAYKEILDLKINSVLASQVEFLLKYFDNFTLDKSIFRGIVKGIKQNNLTSDILSEFIDLKLATSLCDYELTIKLPDTITVNKEKKEYLDEEEYNRFCQQY